MIHVITGFIISLVVLIISLFANKYNKDNNEIIGGRASTSLTTLQREVAREYSNLKLPTHKISFDEFCYPKKFKLQNPQKFIAEYMAPGSPHMNLLGFWGLGSGKSCGILQVTEQWTSKGRPLVVMPASLVGNFLNEMRGPCCDWKYISKEESDELQSLHPRTPRYKEIIKRSNDLIFSKYDIMSYNKFAEEYKKLDPVILAIDETHNILNQSGSYHKKFIKFISARPKMRVMCMSATPIFDNPFELISILKILRQDVTEDILFDKDLLKKKLDGLISFYKGASNVAYPKTTIHYEICQMSKFQSRWFKSEVEADVKRSGGVKLHGVTNNFYSKSRARSNICFPQGLAPTYGINKLTKNMIRENLNTYSCKFARLIKKLRKGQLSFIYSNFSNLGGIKTLVKVLKSFGYLDYKTEGNGPKYAIFSGEETAAEKDAIRKIYNSKENDDGSLIQVIIGSPATREGISFLRCRQVHILDPYWNYSRLAQIIGRAVRVCSHRSLKKSERTVDVYFYIAVTHNSGITKNNFASKHEVKSSLSVDGYILKLAEKKRAENDKIIEIMIDSSVDRGLNQQL